MAQDVLIRFARMNKDRKIRFLAYLSYEITVWLRGAYAHSPVVNSRDSKLMGANELQHHISSQLGHHLDDDLNRYPDDVFLDILSEKAAHYDISSELQHSLDKSLSRFIESSNM